MKKIVSAAIALTFVVAIAGTSVANEWDKACGIAQIGVTGDSDNLLKVENCDKSSHNDMWLSLTKQKDTAMATLLTAFSLGKKVKINADFASASTDGSTYGAVETLYLSN